MCVDERDVSASCNEVITDSVMTMLRSRHQTCATRTHAHAHTHALSVKQAFVCDLPAVYAYAYIFYRISVLQPNFIT